MANKRLAATVMILINGIVLNHSTETKVVAQKPRTTFSPQIAFRHQKHILNRNIYFQYFTSKNGKMNQLPKNKQKFIQDLKNIIIELKNVIGYYDLMKTKLKDLYPGVAACGLNKCENFQGLLPEYPPIKKFKCENFQKGKDLKRWTSKLLSDFHSDVQIFNESFQELINFETSPSIAPVVYDRTNGSRLKMLHKVQTNIKTLIEEIETAVPNKRLIFSHKPREKTLTILPLPKYQNHLMINEWRVIQKSKEFFKGWRKNFHEVSKCWKKYVTFKKELQLKIRKDYKTSNLNVERLCRLA